MAGELGNDAQGCVELNVNFKGPLFKRQNSKCGMVSSVDYNVKHGTIVSLEHSHTLDLHIAGFTDSWNVKSVKDSKNHLTLFHPLAQWKPKHKTG